MATEKEKLVPLLPYGETLRPLIVASSLTGSDLKSLLQKRGIFVKASSKEKTVPVLTSILLSPREFFALKNSQTFKESIVKVSDAQADWNSDQTVVQAIPDEYESFVQKIVPDNASYTLSNCSVQHINVDEVIINCSIKRHDWTKDSFSSTSHHNCKLSISRDPDSNVIIYQTETTIPETKDLITKLQKKTHSYFRQHGAIASNSPIQRVLSNHFITNKVMFEYINAFLYPISDALTYHKIIDIDAGVDHNYGTFPENFQWLKNNIEKINLHGNNLQVTDIMSLGRSGVLVFGEIEAEFGFDYTHAKGRCTIKYGFPRLYEKKSATEFEAKIIDLKLHADFINIPKERVSKFLIQEFQKNKHKLFEEFKLAKKVNTLAREKNQYKFEGEGWDD